MCDENFVWGETKSLTTVFSLTLNFSLPINVFFLEQWSFFGIMLTIKFYYLSFYLCMYIYPYTCLYKYILYIYRISNGIFYLFLDFHLLLGSEFLYNFYIINVMLKDKSLGQKDLRKCYNITFLQTKYHKFLRPCYWTYDHTLVPFL